MKDCARGFFFFEGGGDNNSEADGLSAPPSPWRGFKPLHELM